MAKKKKPKLRFKASRKEIQALYDKARREFSLEDLKAFEVDEKDTIPFSSVLNELKVMIRKAKSKRKSG